MRLEQLADFPGSFIYAERFVNEGTRTYSPFSGYSGVWHRYRPTSKSESFTLPVIAVPKEKTSIYSFDPDPSIYFNHDEGEYVTFCVHPQVLADNSIPYVSELNQYERRDDLRVAPLASTRFVYNLSHSVLPPHGFKLHCPFRISRFVRRLRKVTVEHSILVCQDLASCNFPGCGYLPETLGMTIGTDADGWGFLVREYRVLPQEKETGFLVPLFALYGTDANAPKDEPLAVQLIRHARQDASEFLLESVILPVIKSWCWLARERGLLFDDHGENILLELGQDLLPRRIVRRDLDVEVDIDVRTARGLHCGFPKNRLGIDIKIPKEQFYSLKYDAYLCHHLLKRMLTVVQKHLDIGITQIQYICKEEFHKSLPDASRLFPSDTTYYYGNELLENNEFVLENQHTPPKWR